MDEYVILRRPIFKVGASVVPYGRRAPVLLSRQDRALIERLMRGESEIGMLSQLLTDFEFSGPLPHWREQLERLPERCGLVDIVSPCVFTPRPCVIVSDLASSFGRDLAVHLSRKWPTLLIHAGPDVDAGGQGMGSAAGGKRDRLSEWSPREDQEAMEFVQMIRGFVRRDVSAYLVLCGELDAVCFGGLTAFCNSIVIVDPAWPGRVGVHQVFPEIVESVSRDAAVLDGFFYALSNIPSMGRQLPQALGRATSTACAAMEHIAVLGAGTRLLSRRTQLHLLEDFGVNASDGVCLLTGVLGLEEQSTTGASELESSALLIVCGPDQEWQAIRPLLLCAANLLAEKAVNACFATRGAAWFRMLTTTEAFRLLPERQIPDLRTMRGAVVVAGGIDDWSLVPMLLSKGVRIRIIPTAAGGRSHFALPKSLWLPDAPESWVAGIRQMLSEGDMVDEPGSDSFISWHQVDAVISKSMAPAW